MLQGFPGMSVNVTMTGAAPCETTEPDPWQYEYTGVQVNNNNNNSRLNCVQQNKITVITSTLAYR